MIAKSKAKLKRNKKLHSKTFSNLIICLYGKGDSGKTSTLLELGEILRQKSVKYTEIRANAGSTDKRMVFSVFRSIIGIGTYGDTDDLVEANFNVLKLHKCHIVITAARDKIHRGKTYGPSLSAYMRKAAIWNIAKAWKEKRDDKDVINITGAGEVLHYLVKGTRCANLVDKDVI